MFCLYLSCLALEYNGNQSFKKIKASDRGAAKEQRDKTPGFAGSLKIDALPPSLGKENKDEGGSF